jgi:hypothetical protein
VLAWQHPQALDLSACPVLILPQDKQKGFYGIPGTFIGLDYPFAALRNTFIRHAAVAMAWHCKRLASPSGYAPCQCLAWQAL